MKQGTGAQQAYTPEQGTGAQQTHTPEQGTGAQQTHTPERGTGAQQTHTPERGTGAAQERTAEQRAAAQLADFMRQFRVKNRKALAGDLTTGVVVGLLSVPLSMGFAQVAGLSARYGLYGSLLPVLVFGLLTTSSRFVVGVDAAPAALAAGLVSALGVEPGSPEAAAVMPAITLMTSLWLFLFWIFRGGRFARFVSEPVLEGCVTGIASVVALSQAPLLFGGTAGGGRAVTLAKHLAGELPRFHLLSFALGAGTIAVILLGRRRTRASLSVVMMVLGILLTAVFHLDRYGVALASPVPAGLPPMAALDFSGLSGHVEPLFVDTLAAALVIAAESLVSAREVARRHGESIDGDRELLAYAVGNLAASFAGSSPVCGSMSRTNRVNRRGVTSQWMSVSAFAVTGLVLLLGTPLLAYVPVPILAGIVVASLMTIMEFGLLGRLWKADRPSAVIFLAALGAELLGLAEGVLVGVFLTFAAFTMQSSAQPSYFLGRVDGSEGFFDLARTPRARPVRGTVLYQFNGTLFFATIDDFERDLLDALRPDTRLIVVTGVSAVDMFAAGRLAAFHRRMRERGTALYLAGHASAVNEQLIAYGAEELIQAGAVRQRLTQALRAGGLTPPYPLEERPDGAVPPEAEDVPLEGEPRNRSAMENFGWTYGRTAEKRLERLLRRLSRYREELPDGEPAALENFPYYDELSPAERAVAEEYWKKNAPLS